MYTEKYKNGHIEAVSKTLHFNDPILYSRIHENDLFITVLKRGISNTVKCKRGLYTVTD